MTDDGEAILFPTFLTDESVYRECESYWKALIDEVASSVGQRDQWRSWIPRTFADGQTPMEMNGNPIADGLSRDLGRAFRVIQFDPGAGSGAHDISAFVESRTDPIYEGTIFPEHEMVISLVLTASTAEIARALLRQWMSPSTTVPEIEDSIKQLAPSD